jgi:hypothetical protein
MDVDVNQRGVLGVRICIANFHANLASECVSCLGALLLGLLQFEFEH